MKTLKDLEKLNKTLDHPWYLSEKVICLPFIKVADRVKQNILYIGIDTLYEIMATSKYIVGDDYLYLYIDGHINPVKLEIK